MSVLSFVRSSGRALSVVLCAHGAAACAAGGGTDSGAGGDADTSATQSGTTVATTASSSGASHSASTGMSTSCVPMVGATVGPECGKFVKEGPAGATGDIDKPFNSIRAALATGEKRIYVCTGTFYDALDIPLGVEIFGALDCKNGWLWRASPIIEERSHVVGEPGIPTVRVHGDSSLQARVFGLRIEAVDGFLPGESSIAALVEGGIVRFDYVQFLAGVGVKGADGVELAEPATEGEPGAPGVWDVMGGPFAGGPGVEHTVCPAAISGSGGPGGRLNVNGGFPLAPGGSSAMPLGGAGGLADSDISDCGPGEDGDDAPIADPGVGGTGKGSFDGGRFYGAAGAPGNPGVPGGAGGGGGGNAAFACATQAGWCSGASGGSGGTGGCGGSGGVGGQAGGSSFGLVSLGATVEVAYSTIAVSRGGMGGGGGDGQLGGVGGLGGRGIGGAFGVPKACDGGVGGVGGQGGQGGGGSGGHAIAIAYVGVAPTQNQVSFSLPAQAALGGPGINAGADGLIEEALEF